MIIVEKDKFHRCDKGSAGEMRFLHKKIYFSFKMKQQLTISLSCIGGAGDDGAIALFIVFHHLG